MKRFTPKFFFRRKSQKKNSQKYKNPYKIRGFVFVYLHNQRQSQSRRKLFINFVKV